jgi:peroxiredoxin Q/BCP
VLHIGDPIPAFTLPDQNGRELSSHSLAGRWALLWWYPKAGTLGCTVEGQALRDHSADLEAVGCSVVGMSFDSTRDNRAWANAQEFEFPLLSDVDHHIGKWFGVERDADDQYAAFSLRVSFLVDPKGTVREVFAVSDVADHAASVLAAIEGMQRP